MTRSGKLSKNCLVEEVEFQRRLQALQTGWEWLDELPDESSNEKLVESTIELLVADIVPKATTQTSWLKKNWKQVTFASSLLFALAVGVIGTSVAHRLALRKDLEELAIAEDHEAYKLGGNFEFYRDLAYNRRWQDMLKTMEQVGDREMAPKSVVASIPVDERRAALKELPTKTRERLVGRWEAYNGFSEETKQKMRQTAKEVREADDSERLLRTMKGRVGLDRRPWRGTP